MARHQRSTWQRIKDYFEKRPFWRDLLIGFGVGVAIAGGVAILAATSVFTLPVLTVVGICVGITFGVSLLAGLFGAIKRGCENLSRNSSASDEMALDDLNLETDNNATHKGRVRVGHKPPSPPSSKTNNTEMNAELQASAIAREAAQRKLKEQQAAEEAKLQKELAEAEAKAAEEERKKQIAAAADRNAKGLAKEIVNLLAQQNNRCKQQYVEHHQDEDSFYAHYKQDGHGLMGYIDARCKEQISTDDYKKLTALFAEFKKQFNVEELQKILIEQSISQDEAVRRTIEHEDEMLEDLNQKSGGMMGFVTNQSANFGHQ